MPSTPPLDAPDSLIVLRWAHPSRTRGPPPDHRGIRTPRRAAADSPCIQQGGETPPPPSGRGMDERSPWLCHKNLVRTTRGKKPGCFPQRRGGGQTQPLAGRSPLPPARSDRTDPSGRWDPNSPSGPTAVDGTNGSAVVTPPSSPRFLGFIIVRLSGWMPWNSLTSPFF